MSARSMNTPPWIDRIVRELGASGLLEGLCQALAPSDLQSLLLHVFRERSARRTPSDLVAQFERSALVQPSLADPRVLAELERAAFACAAEFEAIELAPIAPIGINAVLGRIDQNSCLATVRGVEVLADPTTAAALECARRRRCGQSGPIQLCSRSRVLRLQPIEGPGMFPHFGLFSLVTSVRDRGSMLVEFEALRQHLQVHLNLLGRSAVSAHGTLEVSIADTQRNPETLERAQQQVLQPLQRSFPAATFRIDTQREQGRDYYAGLCLSVNAVMPDGARRNLVDGGFTDWTQRLLSNAKERLLVSGIGLERIAALWPTTGPSDEPSPATDDSDALDHGVASSNLARR